MKAKKLSFEESLQRLGEIVKHLEKGDLPLEDSLSLFEEGTELIHACSTLLEAAEQKVTILRTASDGKCEEIPFTGEVYDS